MNEVVLLAIVEVDKTEHVTNGYSPGYPRQQVSVADEWARRQAAREAWQRDELLAMPPISTPQPIPKEWEN